MPVFTKTNAFHDYVTWIKRGGGWSPEVLEIIVHNMELDTAHAKHSGEGRFRPSLIGDPCDRKQLLSYFSEEGSGFYGNWFTWSGTWLHLAFQTYLLETYPDRLRIEHRVVPQEGVPGVTGKADWYWFKSSERTLYGDIAGPHLGDYKTIASLGTIGDAPKPEHVQQLLYEMHVMNLRTAYLVYQTRSFGQMFTWRIDADDHDMDIVGARLQRLQAFVDEEQYPAHLTPCLSHSGPYKDCDWAEQCMDKE